MSVAAMNWVIQNREITDRTEFCLLVALADRADPDGWCHPSQERLAREARMSRATAQRTLDELERRGVIVRHRKVANRPCSYRLNMVTAMPPRLIPDGSDPSDRYPQVPHGEALTASSGEALTLYPVPHGEAVSASSGEAVSASSGEARTVRNRKEPSARSGPVDNPRPEGWSLLSEQERLAGLARLAALRAEFESSHVSPEEPMLSNGDGSTQPPASAHPLVDPSVRP